mgnify:FL=1
MVARCTSACSSAAAPDTMTPRAGLHTPPAGGVISGGFGFAPVCILSHRLHGRMASGTDFPHGRQRPFPSCKSTAPNPIRSAPAAHSGRMALSRPGGGWLRQRSGPTFFWSARAMAYGHVHAEAPHVEHGPADAGEGHGREEHAVRVRAGRRHDLASGLQAGLLDPRAGHAFRQASRRWRSVQDA